MKLERRLRVEGGGPLFWWCGFCLCFCFPKVERESSSVVLIYSIPSSIISDNLCISFDID